eukprot:TRINITY_DN528_c0_g1_i2.p1 TRINITY_DN528_c0_g1~~TRINITY_DN528_c0_g1_i2.p1  ORF type:complete len:290 (+),score=32.42 TRINITY_DN528_c0_g1_i2:72-872(+)
MDIIVKTLDGQQYPVSVELDCFIEELRLEVFKAGGPPAGLQRLVVKGKPMEDGKTLREYGVSSSSQSIHLIVKSAPPQPQMILKNSDGRIIVVSFDRLKCLLISDIIDLTRQVDEHLKGTIHVSLPNATALNGDQSLKDLGLSEGGSLRINTSGVLRQQEEVFSPSAPAAPAVEMHQLSPEMYQFLVAQHLTDYAALLSRDGIRTFDLLCECTPADLPAELPNPVRRLLLSKAGGAKSAPEAVAPSAPSAPPVDQTNGWITDFGTK